MDEAKKLVTEIESIVNSGNLSLEEIETLKQTLGLLKANTEMQLVEDVLDANEQAKEEVVEVLQSKAEELSNSLESEKVTASAVGVEEQIKKEAKVESLYDQLIKVVQMKDGMKANDLKATIDALLIENKEEIRSLIEPCIGTLLAESGLDLENYTNSKDKGSRILTGDFLIYAKDAFYDIYTDENVQKQLMSCLEIREQSEKASKELREAIEADKELGVEIKRLELMKEQYRLGISPDLLTDKGAKQLEEKRNELDVKIQEINEKRSKLDNNILSRIFFSKKIDKLRQERDKMHAEKEKLCIKINGINEIKSKAREIGRNTLTSEENLQAYISNASKTNPKALEELLTERKSRLDRESVIRDEFVSHDRDEKWKKSEEIGSRFCKEREKLPRNVRNFIEMKQVNLDMLKLATTKNKEVIAAALIGSSLGFNIANTRIVDDNELDIDKIAEKYNEIKERNQLKQQTQQQIQANSVLQGVMLGDNLYMQEMLEEESQGMRM